MNKNLIYMVSNNKSLSLQQQSWKYWCDKNKVDFISSEDIDFDLFEKYDKIGLVSNQIMIKWNAKNIFDDFDDDDFCGVLDTINFKVIYDEVKDYENFDISKYIKEDVLFFGKKYIKFLEKCVSENTSINYMLQKNNINVKELTQNWNMDGLITRHLLSHNWQLKEDSTSFFIKYGDIWNLREVNDEILHKIWESIRGMYQ